jgi:hypothetical protein
VGSRPWGTLVNRSTYSGFARERAAVALPGGCGLAGRELCVLRRPRVRRRAAVCAARSRAPVLQRGGGGAPVRHRRGRPRPGPEGVAHAPALSRRPSPRQYGRCCRQRRAVQWQDATAPVRLERAERADPRCAEPGGHRERAHGPGTAITLSSLELCSAPCKALRSASTPRGHARGLRALTAPAPSSPNGHLRDGRIRTPRREAQPSRKESTLSSVL